MRQKRPHGWGTQGSGGTGRRKLGWATCQAQKQVFAFYMLRRGLAGCSPAEPASASPDATSVKDLWRQTVKKVLALDSKDRWHPRRGGRLIGTAATRPTSISAGCHTLRRMPSRCPASAESEPRAILSRYHSSRAFMYYNSRLTRQRTTHEKRNHFAYYRVNHCMFRLSLCVFLAASMAA